MSGFDDLERQLRGAVRERASKAPAGRRRWRTGRALALAATLVVPAGGVAVAAGMLGSDDRTRAQDLFSSAVTEAQGLPACEEGPEPLARYSDATRSPRRSTPSASCADRPERATPCPSGGARTPTARRSAA